MRTLWQGAEGIAWLCVADTSKIEGGAYYLDRSPQPKHLSGPFFSEGSYTKNSPAEVEEMMANLELWANNNRPTPEESAVVAALEKPLKATSKAVQTERFMGDWNVLAMIPTIVETSVTNSIEKYEWNEAEKTIRIKFNYVVKDSTQSTNFSFKAKLANPPVNTHWSLSPKVGIYLPLNLSYLILDVADDYSYSIIGVPDRSYVWVMIRALPSQFEKFMIPVTEEYNLAAPAIKKKPAGVVALTAPDDPNAEVSPINIPYSLPTAPAATATDEERKNYEREVLKVAMLKIAELGMDGSKLVRAPWNHELEGK